MMSYVVAVSRNGVIGREGGLPWHISSDLKRFKEITMGKPVVMGRKTWESLPRRPLPGRLNIVVSRDPAYQAEGAARAASVDDALRIAAGAGAEEIAVIGGGDIFRALFDRADRLNVTHVLGKVPGDTFFPAIYPGDWRVLESADHPAGERDSHPTRYVVYERRR